MRNAAWLLVSVAMASVLAVPALPVSASHRFVDVPDTHTFHEDIAWLAEFGITKGCNPSVNDRFCPDDPVTRGQMAAFIVRAMGYVDDAGGDLFTDDDDSTFEAEIDKLATAGVTRGCNPPVNDRFCPDDPVTRGQMAAFIVRAMGYVDDAGGDLFTDDDDSTFEAEIDKLATAGVTRGCNPPENDRFCPGDTVTRGQMAAFLNRSLTDICLTQDSITRYECEALKLTLETDDQKLADLIDQCREPDASVVCDQGHVVGLRHVPMTDYVVFVLPPQIGRLTHLEQLRLLAEYAQLPPEIGELQALRELFVANPVRLPDEIGSLKSLESFSASNWHGEDWCSEPEFPSSCYGSGLGRLPSTFANLTSLRILDLRSNGFGTIPEEITDLTNLTYLNLSENPLESLPPEIGQMINLEELHLTEDHYLSALPPEIGQLSNLNVLRVGGRLEGESLTTLPPEIGSLANLETLGGEGLLESLPPEVGQLSNLKTLDFGGNRLTTLIPEIGNLSSLETLDLGSNQIQALIPAIGNLQALHTLDLRSNGLAGPVPIEFLQLASLESLRLKGQRGCLTASTQELEDWLDSFDPEWNYGCL